jgi:hypothetical protein
VHAARRRRLGAASRSITAKAQSARTESLCQRLVLLAQRADGHERARGRHVHSASAAAKAARYPAASIPERS